MREQQVGYFLNKLGEFVIQLLPRHPGEECNPLKQALDVWISRHSGKHRRQSWISFGGLRRQSRGLGEFVFVVAV